MDLADVDGDRVCGLAIDREHDRHFASPSYGSRDLDIDLVEPREFALRPGESDWSVDSADGGANIGESGVFAQPRAEESEEDRIARTTEVDRSCRAG